MVDRPAPERRREVERRAAFETGGDRDAVAVRRGNRLGEGGREVRDEEKSGDKLAGVGAESVEERVAAKAVLSHITLKDLYETPAVPYEQDEVTRIIIDAVDPIVYAGIKNWTVSELREWILDTATTGEMIRTVSAGLTRCPQALGSGGSRPTGIFSGYFISKLPETFA